LDALLSLDDAATWLGISAQRLRAKTIGRRPPVPAFRLNRRVMVFHPRTILAKMAADAGVSAEVIAASMGRQEHETKGPPAC
jgi:hypothetical protein